MSWRTRGQILLIVLVLTFMAATLAFALTIWSQESQMLARRSSADLTRTRLSHGLELQMRSEIAAQPTKALEGTDTFSIVELATKASVSWDEENQSPIVSEASSGENLFQKDTVQVDYSEEAKVQAWHRQATIDLPGNHHRKVVFRNGLEHAISAPWGEIEVAGEIDSWNNASFDDKGDNITLALSPVKIQAYDDITVSGNFAYGQASSETGEVELASSSSALALSNFPIQPDGYDSLDKALVGSGGIYDSLKARALDKRNFIAGTILDPKGFWDFLNGKSSLLEMFSVQQLCNIPMPVIPTLYNYELLDVIALHHPFPSDFNAFKIDGIKGLLKDILDKLNPINDAKAAIKAAKEAIKNAANTIAHIGRAIWDALKGKLKRARRELERAKDDLVKAGKALLDAIKALTDFFDPFMGILNGVGELPIHYPHTKHEEKETVTAGFTYFAILRRIEGALVDFFKGVFSGNFDALIYDLMNPIRIVHFTDRAPFGGFSDDGGWTIAWTMNVPRGRTLKFGPQGGAGSADFVILGDLWIAKGATLVVEGNLFVQAPPENIWLYRTSAEKTEEKEGPEFRPTGTIYLEEGASLVVSGNLYAQGEGKEQASLVAASNYDSTPVLSSAVICKGDVRLPGGVGPGVPLTNLLNTLSKDVPVAGELSKNLVTPLLDEIAPHMAKVLGPWDERECWFADYATTFVMIPELVEFGLQGPWPIPMPYSNCARHIFDALTKVARVSLNFTLGDNLVTHTSWWILGEGIVPVSPKVEPETYVEAASSELRSIERALTPSNILHRIEGFMEKVIPEIVEALVKDVIQAIVKNIIGEATGIEDPCAGKEDEGEEEEEDKAVKEFLEEVEGTIKRTLKNAFRAMAKAAFDKVASSISEDVHEGAFREVSGALVYSGGKLTIAGGEGLPATAIGLFIAEGDIEMQARHVIGACSSRTGDVSIQGSFHAYPYFSQAFLYLPQDPSSFLGGGNPPSWLKNFEDLFKDAIYLKTPTGGEASDIISKTAVVTAHGRVSP